MSIDLLIMFSLCFSLLVIVGIVLVLVIKVVSVRNPKPNDIVFYHDESADSNEAERCGYVYTDPADRPKPEGTFMVELMDPGSEKVIMIKMVRELTGLGLKEAKEAVDFAPTIILQHVSQERAQRVAEILISEGAKAAVRDRIPY